MKVVAIAIGYLVLIAMAAVILTLVLGLGSGTLIWKKRCVCCGNIRRLAPGSESCHLADSSAGLQSPVIQW